MTQRLLIIGGGIQGMMSASAAAQSGARSELIVTEHALGPMGASLNSAGENLPHGRRNRTRSLTRKCPVALTAMAASAVSGGLPPVAKRVVAGPGEVSDRDQLREPEDPAWPRMGSLAPNLCGQYSFLEHRWTRCQRRASLIARPERELVAKICAAHDLRCVRLHERSSYRAVAPSTACSAVTTMQTYRIDRSLRAWAISPLRRDNKALQSTRSGTHFASPSACRGVSSPWAHTLTAPDRL